MTKEKSRAEATANSLNREQYISIRQQMQDHTHVSDLFEWLWECEHITSMEAFRYLHNTRVSATVFTLRHDYGVPVQTKMITKKGHTYGVYWLDKEV